MSLFTPARSPFVVPSAPFVPGGLDGHRLRHDPNEINHLAQPRAAPPTSPPTTPTPLRSVRPVVPGPRAGCERALTWTACCASRAAGASRQAARDPRLGLRVSIGPPGPAARAAGAVGGSATAPAPHLHRATRCALRPVLRAPAISPHLPPHLGGMRSLDRHEGDAAHPAGSAGAVPWGRGGRRRGTPPGLGTSAPPPPCAQRGRPYLSRPAGPTPPPAPPPRPPTSPRPARNNP